MYSIKNAGLVICAVIVWSVSFLNVIVMAVDADNYDVVVAVAVVAAAVAAAAAAVADDVVAVVVIVD